MQNTPALPSVVLLSGGLDSTALLHHVVKQRKEPALALSFDYGQRHNIELEHAKYQAALVGARHVVVTLPVGALLHSALTGHNLAPDASPIPATYVPMRNTLFLALACGVAESSGNGKIYIGANYIDYSGYPDCRPEFLSAFQFAANRGCKKYHDGGFAFEIMAPLLYKTKAQIVRMALDLSVDLDKTSSCYFPDETGAACGMCDSCVIRNKAIKEAM